MKHVGKRIDLEKKKLKAFIQFVHNNLKKLEILNLIHKMFRKHCVQDQSSISWVIKCDVFTMKVLKCLRFSVRFWRILQY